MMRKSRTSRRAQPAKSQSQSGYNTPTNTTQESINKGQKLQIIKLSLLNTDGDTKQIGVYHGIKVSELKAMIKTVYNLSNNINIIGIKSQTNNKCLIPLSYISNNPDVLLSNDEIYQLILDAPIPITNASRFMKLMQTTKKNIKQNWRIYSLIGLPSLILIWQLRLFPWTIAYYMIHIILSPLLITLYRYGPSFTIFNMQIGFWNGLPVESICAVLSGHNAIFWSNNADECIKMVNNKQNAFILLIESTFWLIIIYQALKLLLKYIKMKMSPKYAPRYYE